MYAIHYPHHFFRQPWENFYRYIIVIHMIFHFSTGLSTIQACTFHKIFYNIVKQTCKAVDKYVHME